VEEPPPPYAFEISESGVAYCYAAKGTGRSVVFNPFPTPVLQVSPVKENVFNAELFQAHVEAIARATANGNGRKRRQAALILPDYCTRIALLDFDTFPKEAEEQGALVRFRMKKTVPFDMDAAAVSYQTRKAGGGKTEVLVAAAATEIVAKYEAPFRVAGFHTGFVTTAMLAALDLLPKSGLQICAKIGGQTMTVAVCDGRQPRLIRCVEMENFAAEEVMGVLYPTFAYAEDELKARPQRMFTCGFERMTPGAASECAAEMDMVFEPLLAPGGETARAEDAGLRGWICAQQERI
jgi:type IV pilus assembly protein PilM